MPQPDNKRQKRGRPQDLRQALGLGRSSLSVPTEQFMPQLPGGSRNVFIEPSANAVDTPSQISFGNMTPGPSGGLEVLRGLAGAVTSGFEAYAQAKKYATAKQQKEIDDILADEEVIVQYQSPDPELTFDPKAVSTPEDQMRAQLDNTALRKSSPEYRSMLEEINAFQAGGEDPGFRLVDDPSRTFGLMHDRITSAMKNMNDDGKRYARQALGRLSDKAKIDYSKDQIKALNLDMAGARNLADQFEVIAKYEDDFVSGTPEYDRLMELKAQASADRAKLTETMLVEKVINDFETKWQSMSEAERLAIPDGWVTDSLIGDNTIAEYLNVEREADESDEEYAERFQDALERVDSLMTRVSKEDLRWKRERAKLERDRIEEMEKTQVEAVLTKWSEAGAIQRYAMLEEGTYIAARERKFKLENLGEPPSAADMQRERLRAIKEFMEIAVKDGKVAELATEMNINIEGMSPEDTLHRMIHMLTSDIKGVGADDLAIENAELQFAEYLLGEEDTIRNQAWRQGWTPVDKDGNPQPFPENLQGDLDDVIMLKNRYQSANESEKMGLLYEFGFGPKSFSVEEKDVIFDDFLSAPATREFITGQYRESYQEQKNNINRYLDQWNRDNADNLTALPPTFGDFVRERGFRVDALVASIPGLRDTGVSLTLLNEERDLLGLMADESAGDYDPDENSEDLFNDIMKNRINNEGIRNQTYINLRAAMAEASADYKSAVDRSGQARARDLAKAQEQRRETEAIRGALSTVNALKPITTASDSATQQAQRMVNDATALAVLQNTASRLVDPTGLMTTSIALQTLSSEQQEKLIGGLQKGDLKQVNAALEAAAGNFQDPNSRGAREVRDLQKLFSPSEYSIQGLQLSNFESDMGKNLAIASVVRLKAMADVGHHVALPGMTDSRGNPFTVQVRMDDSFENDLSRNFAQDILEPLRSVAMGSEQGREEFLDIMMRYKEAVLEYGGQRAYFAHLTKNPNDTAGAQELLARYRESTSKEIGWSVINQAQQALGFDNESAVGLMAVSQMFPAGVADLDDSGLSMVADIVLGMQGFRNNYGQDYDNRFGSLKSAFNKIMANLDNENPTHILNGMYAVAIGIRTEDDFAAGVATDNDKVPMNEQFDKIRDEIKYLIPGSENLSNAEFDSLVVQHIMREGGVANTGFITAFSLLNQKSSGGLVRGKPVSAKNFFRLLLSGAELADGRRAIPTADGGVTLTPRGHEHVPSVFKLPSGVELGLSHDTRAALRTVTSPGILFGILENPDNYEMTVAEREIASEAMTGYVEYLDSSGYFQNGGLDMASAVLAVDEIVRQAMGVENNNRLAPMPRPRQFAGRSVYAPTQMQPSLSFNVTRDGREIRFPDPHRLMEMFTAGGVFMKTESGTEFRTGEGGESRSYGLISNDFSREEQLGLDYLFEIGGRNYTIPTGIEGKGTFLGDYNVSSPLGSMMYLEAQAADVAKAGLDTDGPDSVLVGQLRFPGQLPIQLRDVTPEQAIIIRDQLIEQARENIIKQMVTEGYLKRDDSTGKVTIANQYVALPGRGGEVSGQVRFRELMYQPKMVIRYLEDLVVPGEQESERFFNDPRANFSGEGGSVLDTGILKSVPEPASATFVRGVGRAPGYVKRNPYSFLFTPPEFTVREVLENPSNLGFPRGDRPGITGGKARKLIEAADGHRNLTLDFDIFGMRLGGTPTSSVRDMTRYFNPDGSLDQAKQIVGIEKKVRVNPMAVGGAIQRDTEGPPIFGSIIGTYFDQLETPGAIDFGSPEHKLIYDYIRKNHPEVEFRRLERSSPGPGFEGSTSIYATNLDGNQLYRIALNAEAFKHRANLGLEYPDMPGADEARARFDYDGSVDLPPMALEAAADIMGPPRTTPDTGGAPEGFEERQRAIAALAEGERPLKVNKALEQFFDNFSADEGDFNYVGYDQAPMLREEQQRRLTKLKNIEKSMNYWLAAGARHKTAAHFEVAQDYADRYAKVLKFYEEVPLDKYIEYLDDNNMLPPGYKMSVMGTILEDRPIRGRVYYKGE